MSGDKTDGRLFFLWIIGLMLCVTIEIAFQKLAGISNIGVIGAVFLAITFIHDFYYKVKMVK
jgi:hypothetical protein